MTLSVFDLMMHNSTENLVTLSITTCKRLHLFRRTVRSLLRHCSDLLRVSEFICVDDNSSESDRRAMMDEFPFFTFIWKTRAEKGHARSMNIILERVQTPFLFHLEDDWEFLKTRPYIAETLSVLDSDETLGQCLVNVNYAELPTDQLLGGDPKTLPDGLRYRIHVHIPEKEIFKNRFGTGPNSGYWPHYSLRPGMNRVCTLRKVGQYTETKPHFEMQFAYRYAKAGFRTAFLDDICSKHIGPLTSELNKVNAYQLNDEHQFTPRTSPSNVMRLINLDRRPDRLKKVTTDIRNRVKEDEVSMDSVQRVSAVDGDSLSPSPWMYQLFRPNDYSFRKHAIGCALSHLRLWCECAYSKLPYMVVLEDDIHFFPYFQLRLEYALEQHSDWDVIFLSHLQRNGMPSAESACMPEVIRRNKNESFRASKGGTSAYAITPRGALKLLQFVHRRGMTNGIDTMMQHAADEVEVYYCEPQLVRSLSWSDTCDSDIQFTHEAFPFDACDFALSELTRLSPGILVCDGETHPERGVVFCNHGCTRPRYSYFLTDDAWIHVYEPPPQGTRFVGMWDMVEERFSVDHMIV